MATARPGGGGVGNMPTPPLTRATAPEHPDHVRNIINMAKNLQSMFMDPKQTKEPAATIQRLLEAILQHLPAHLRADNNNPQGAAVGPTNPQKIAKRIEETHKMVAANQNRPAS